MSYSHNFLKGGNVGPAYAGALSLMSSSGANSGSWVCLGTLFNVKFWVPK